MANNESNNLTTASNTQSKAAHAPYDGVAQLDLLKSFDSNRTPAFHQQASKTALFFSNTYWLSWQLQKADEDELTDSGEATVTDDDESRYVTDEEPIPNKPVTVSPVIAPAHVATDEAETVDTPANGDLSSTSENEAAQHSSEEKLPVATDDPGIHYVRDEEPISNDPVSSKPVEESRPAEQSSTITEQANTAVQVTDSRQEQLAFEPLHTVDYFASQGIKVTEEPIADDKLGKQLKSFTQWLKSMKKVHTPKLAPADDITDKRIQSIAEESNSEAEVFTESMAEVYEKQGKTAKAIEVYEKLSLINPAKSAYFAAKIDGLKAN
jgi:hypothetical protein